MLSCQLPPSSISFNVALHVCSMAGRWLKALQLCRKAGPAADVISYSTSISACEPWPWEHEGAGPEKNMGNQGAAKGFLTTYRLECKSCQIADFRRFPPGNILKSPKLEHRIAHLKRTVERPHLRSLSVKQNGISSPGATRAHLILD